MTLHVLQNTYKSLLKHSIADYPKEACGFLAGPNFLQCTEFFALKNLDNSPTTYLADPKEQMNLFKKFNLEHKIFVGIFHSHPHTEAVPSERDIEMAFYEEVLYFILSLRDKDNPILKAYTIIKGSVTPVEFQIV